MGGCIANYCIDFYNIARLAIYFSNELNICNIAYAKRIFLGVFVKESCNSNFISFNMLKTHTLCTISQK